MIDENTPPFTPNTILQYVKNNKEVNFARFSDKDYSFKELNRILVPIFMRWGNVNELISGDAKDLANFMKDKIKNINKDIGYIDGATHHYTKKEEVLAKQIVEFIQRNERR